MGEYFRNMTTNKLEMYIGKEEYGKLDPAIKDKIKRHFLFSRKKGAWISKAKFPNLYTVEEIAKEIGLDNKGKVGERLTFEESQNVKADRASNRAVFYEDKAEKARDNAEKMQKPFMDMDYAAATQPIHNTSGGRSFASYKNRIIMAYDRGMEEFRKSEYYAKCADKARNTAKQATTCSKGFCQRRIEDAERAIRAEKRNLEIYEERLEGLRNHGEAPVDYLGIEPVTEETVLKWIDTATEIIQTNIEKIAYYDKMIEDAGGLKFSKENINIGDVVCIEGWQNPVTVVNKGTKTITYTTDPDRHFKLRANYAEIIRVVKTA